VQGPNLVAFEEAIAAQQFVEAREYFIRHLEETTFFGKTIRAGNFAALMRRMVPAFANEYSALGGFAGTLRILAACDFRLKMYATAVEYYQVAVETNKLIPVTAINADDAKDMLKLYSELITAQQLWGDFLGIEATFLSVKQFIADVTTQMPTLVDDELKQKIKTLDELEKTYKDIADGYRALQRVVATPADTFQTDASFIITMTSEWLDADLFKDNIPALYLKIRARHHMKCALREQTLIPWPSFITNFSLVLQDFERLSQLLLGDAVANLPVNRENFERAGRQFEAYKYFGQETSTSEHPFFDHVFALFLDLVNLEAANLPVALKLNELAFELATVYGAQAIESKKDYTSALNYYKRAWRSLQLVKKCENPIHPVVRFNLGRCHMRLGQFNNARQHLITAFDSVDQLTPSAVKYLLNVVVNLQMLGEFAQAQRYYQNFASSSPVTEAASSSSTASEVESQLTDERAKVQLVLKAEEMRAAKNHQQAIGFYEQYLALTSTNVVARLLYGACLLQAIEEPSKLKTNYEAVIIQLLGMEEQGALLRKTAHFTKAIQAYQNYVPEEHKTTTTALQFFELIFRPYILGVVLEILHSDTINVGDIANANLITEVAGKYYREVDANLTDVTRKAILNKLQDIIYILQFLKLLKTEQYPQLAALSNMKYHAPISIYIRMIEVVVLALQSDVKCTEKAADVRKLLQETDVPNAETVKATLIEQFELALLSDASKKVQVATITALVEQRLYQLLISASQQKAVEKLQGVARLDNTSQTNRLSNK